MPSFGFILSFRIKQGKRDEIIEVFQHFDKLWRCNLNLITYSFNIDPVDDHKVTLVEIYSTDQFWQEKQTKNQTQLQLLSKLGEGIEHKSVYVFGNPDAESKKLIDLISPDVIYSHEIAGWVYQ